MTKYENRVKEVGRRIAEERKKLQLSRKELLPKIYKSEKSHKMLASWENGERLPDLDSIALMAELFDCDIGYLLGDYTERRRVVADVCKETGLSEQAVSRLILYKNQYPDYVQSLSFLLESANFENALGYIEPFKESLEYLDVLHRAKKRQIAALADIRDYESNISLSKSINEAIKESDLCAYNLSSNMGFIVQEMRNKFCGSAQEPKD